MPMQSVSNTFDDGILTTMTWSTVKLGFTRQRIRNMERTQKGGTGRFGGFHDIQKDDKADVRDMAELGTMKIRRYHFENKAFKNLIHKDRFNPDHLYRFLSSVWRLIRLLDLLEMVSLLFRHYTVLSGVEPYTVLLNQEIVISTCIIVMVSLLFCHYTVLRDRALHHTTEPRDRHLHIVFTCQMAAKFVRPPMRSKFIPLSDGWMCGIDEEKGETSKGKDSVEKKELERKKRRKTRNNKKKIPRKMLLLQSRYLWM
ncbi:hypothetical protein PIB30_081990 [Stylosanthes scabra]|uniref:Uncharacterized protein n=1 Tax=Stylosanthes scabra TaxID=79078 RepID=A0ABU6RS12_9FABA|nr:hypothetical protein [Stylosanthes scabra]